MVSVTFSVANGRIKGAVSILYLMRVKSITDEVLSS